MGSELKRAALQNHRTIEHLIAAIGPAPRVLCCGSRSGSNRGLVHLTLNALHALSPIQLLINGKATGYDTLADNWARQHGIQTLQFPADWRKHGRGAGPIRNRMMLEEGKPDLVVAFPGDRGTTNMIDVANTAGVPVFLAGWAPVRRSDPWRGEQEHSEIGPHQRQRQVTGEGAKSSGPPIGRSSSTEESE